MVKETIIFLQYLARTLNRLAVRSSGSQTGHVCLRILLTNSICRSATSTVKRGLDFLHSPQLNRVIHDNEENITF
jgi:hypothetical protein